MTVGFFPMVDRLQRLDRIFENQPVYFVTACTSERKAILADAKVLRGVEQFAQAGPNHGVWLGAFVLMPDHFHAFVSLDEQRTALSLWIKSFKNLISKILRDKGLPSPHWQKGFFDHVLRSTEPYLQKWEYVRENPVRAGLVSTWEDWPYRGEPFEFFDRRS